MWAEVSRLFVCVLVALISVIIRSLHNLRVKVQCAYVCRKVEQNLVIMNSGLLYSFARLWAMLLHKSALACMFMIDSLQYGLLQNCNPHLLVFAECRLIAKAIQRIIDHLITVQIRICRNEFLCSVASWGGLNKWLWFVNNVCRWVLRACRCNRPAQENHPELWQRWF